MFPFNFAYQAAVVFVLVVFLFEVPRVLLWSFLWKGLVWAPRGPLQPVLMRPTPQLSVKTWKGGGSWGGGSLEGVGLQPGGGGWHKASVSDCLPLAPIGLSPLLILTLGRGVPKVGGPACDPLLPHAYLRGGCVSRGLGVWRYACDNSLLIWRSKHGWFDEREACTKKNWAPLAPCNRPTISQNPGGGSHTRTGPGRPPRVWADFQASTLIMPLQSPKPWIDLSDDASACEGRSWILMWPNVETLDPSNVVKNTAHPICCLYQACSPCHPPIFAPPPPAIPPTHPQVEDPIPKGTCPLRTPGGANRYSPSAFMVHPPHTHCFKSWCIS